MANDTKVPMILNLLSAILVLALVIDFTVVIRTALSVE